MRSKNDITQKWKDETILQAKNLADRVWKGKIIRSMDRYHRGVETADYVMAKEAENDVYNLTDNLRLEAGVVQALAERERILGIVDEYNLGGQLNGIIELIKKV